MFDDDDDDDDRSGWAFLPGVSRGPIRPFMGPLLFFSSVVLFLWVVLGR